jgi:ubiquinone/menaquinone biosynthesis C-methylase UbiE
MDPYTQKTKEWLEIRYQQVNGTSGIYFAHQPIYGYDRGCSEPGLYSRYAITYAIMKALTGLHFKTLLDVGSSEGYKAYLVQQIFGAIVKGTDLSEEACRRAGEIFGIDAAWADIHHLPYEDEEFDVVLCSETLEHAADLSAALEELLRVAKKAVIITVPHESTEVIEKNIYEDVDHGHIHSFHTGSLDFLQNRGYAVSVKKFDIPLLHTVGRFIDANFYEGKNYPGILIQLYNRLLQPWAKKVFNSRIGVFSCASLIRLDELLSPLVRGYNAILFVIVKDPACVIDWEKRVHLPVRKIMNITVPYHYLASSRDKSSV